MSTTQEICDRVDIASVLAASVAEGLAGSLPYSNPNQAISSPAADCRTRWRTGDLVARVGHIDRCMSDRRAQTLTSKPHLRMSLSPQWAWPKRHLRPHHPRRLHDPLLLVRQARTLGP